MELTQAQIRPTETAPEEARWLLFNGNGLMVTPDKEKRPQESAVTPAEQKRPQGTPRLSGVEAQHAAAVPPHGTQPGGA